MSVQDQAQPNDDLEPEVDSDDPLVVEGDIAGDYLERLLDILDLDGDIDLDVEGSRAVVAVDGGDLAHLVGPRGQTLDALQELTRLAVTARTGNRSRLMLDIDGYRADRRSSLTQIAKKAIEDVRDRGESTTLAAMNPFERKVVHDVVADADGVVSESTGEEPNRRVVILPA
ncbi:KH domain-containing protein [Epidermidibacterium keratini]|uniref:KH domain-containing protein n=1 Tax=Epidermidibacterium keratini TaxID=1891644 RepID=A0A7L4YNL3_9ACTN|nr:R3H domain-containing nucleic acid-binding protein [Epidermidibacterium keratini]QHC00483.1 KH domain-containing protein [Epidermidibacterium keratini]